MTIPMVIALPAGLAAAWDGLAAAWDGLAAAWDGLVAAWDGLAPGAVVAPLEQADTRTTAAITVGNALRRLNTDLLIETTALAGKIDDSPNHTLFLLRSTSEHGHGRPAAVCLTVEPSYR
jgi:hypothetical protein